MSGRDDILRRIRASLGSGDGEAGRAQAVARRLKRHPRGIIPDTGADTGADTVARFVDKARAAAATVETVRSANVGKAIVDFLRAHNLPQRLRAGADERLRRIAWPKGGEPEILAGASDGDDVTGLSHAFAGVGETGTLVLLSGADNPSTVNFLPENHIVIVDAADIAADYETVWTRLRRRFGASKMPRTVNLVTGPSRSADIEQTLIMGAHGPVRLHVIVVTG
ncbi:MAG: hypothetical protein BroJett030_12950 [Alphaproteobacteria bacterium]|nr:MAG: hypothetical protein BroJett030_12950 [Alphaproteobacteria bacterium]